MRKHADIPDWLKKPQTGNSVDEWLEEAVPEQSGRKYRELHDKFVAPDDGTQGNRSQRKEDHSVDNANGLSYSLPLPGGYDNRYQNRSYGHYPKGPEVRLTIELIKPGMYYLQAHDSEKERVEFALNILGIPYDKQSEHSFFLNIGSNNMPEGQESVMSYLEKAIKDAAKPMTLESAALLQVVAESDELAIPVIKKALIRFMGRYKNDKGAVAHALLFAFPTKKKLIEDLLADPSLFNPDYTREKGDLDPQKETEVVNPDTVQPGTGEYDRKEANVKTAASKEDIQNRVDEVLRAMETVASFFDQLSAEHTELMPPYLKNLLAGAQSNMMLIRTYVNNTEGK